MSEMLLCISCTNFIRDFDPPYAHSVERFASSFYETSFSCRICTAVWAKLYQINHQLRKRSSPICLSLSQDSAHCVRLEVTIRYPNEEWILKADKLEKIPTYGPKFVWRNLCTFDFTEKSLEPNQDIARDTCDEAWHEIELEGSRPPVEFFERFLPELKRWLKACNSHQSCREQRNRKTLPTRLLYVGKQRGELRLRRSLEDRIRPNSIYLTMSYRWCEKRQGEEEMCLRDHNLEDWLIRIPETQLPQTLQDGITVCRLLNCRYIWIDALCIIQGSPSDWINESSLMAAVYSGSYLNLAASSVVDVSPVDGLFRRCNALLGDRNPMSIEVGNALYVQTESRQNRGGKSDDKYYWPEDRVARYDIFRKDFERSPLHKRGWVFQELYLSCRTLHFLETTFWWQCKSCVTFGYPKMYLDTRKDKCWGLPSMVFTRTDSIGLIDDSESEPAKRKLLNPWLFNKIALRHPVIAPARTPLVTRALVLMWWERDLIYLDPAISALREEWIGLANRYVPMDLTRESDRQVAIAGLASRFNDRFERCGHPATYHAGLWSHVLLVELLWTTSRLKPGEKYGCNCPTLEDELGCRCSELDEKYGCPSWSWLYSNSGFEHIQSRDITSFHPLADIQEVKTVLKHSGNKFGPVKFGLIRVCAYSFKEKLGFREWITGRSKLFVIDMDVDYDVAFPKKATTVKTFQEIGATYKFSEDSNEELTFVILAYGKSWPRAKEYHGLILQKAPEKYPLMPDGRKGPFWVRRGKWAEGIHGERNVEEETRKFLEVETSSSRVVQTFQII